MLTDDEQSAEEWPGQWTKQPFSAITALAD
jgi:hypothetical protein